jgi:hypothetical protein
MRARRNSSSFSAYLTGKGALHYLQRETGRHGRGAATHLDADLHRFQDLTHWGRVVARLVCKLPPAAALTGHENLANLTVALQNAFSIVR